MGSSDFVRNSSVRVQWSVSAVAPHISGLLLRPWSPLGLMEYPRVFVPDVNAVHCQCRFYLANPADPTRRFPRDPAEPPRISSYREYSSACWHPGSVEYVAPYAATKRGRSDMAMRCIFPQASSASIHRVTAHSKWPSTGYQEYWRRWRPGSVEDVALMQEPGEGDLIAEALYFSPSLVSIDSSRNRTCRKWPPTGL